ncbi:hypothetical protein [Granulicatella sp. WM01]|uniref:hypothetical protein n=1 Tax=Granulicatella sp. WM01 TaxID=2558277 RepID=UPI001431D8B6|nr:hypothetical protein [Granulicatella sp. WM01]
MFYIIEQHKNLQITKIISNYLKNRYPRIVFKILQSFKAHPSHQSNTYFIINKDIYLNEQELEVAKNIRKNDRFGHIILISKNINYLQLFRSHINFLEIIDCDNNLKEEIYNCIDFLKKNIS